jgi:hypothetical protein
MLIKQEVFEEEEKEAINTPLLQDYNELSDLERGSAKKSPPAAAELLFTQQDKEAQQKKDDVKTMEKQRVPRRVNIMGNQEETKAAFNVFAIKLKDKFNDFDKNELVHNHKETVEKKMREAEDKRQKDMMEFQLAQAGKAFKNVLFP